MHNYAGSQPKQWDRRTVLEEKFKIAVRTAKQQGTGNALDI